MMLDPVCESAKALGHSWWPSPHWWLSLTAGDQGAWISGLGAFAAAAVALRIAGSDRREREKQRRDLAQVAGQYLFTDIHKLVVFTGLAQRTLRSLADVPPSTPYAEDLLGLDNCISQMKGIVDRIALERISLLPVAVGGSVACGFGGYPILLDGMQTSHNMLRLGHPIDMCRDDLRGYGEDLKDVASNLKLFFMWYALEFYPNSPNSVARQALQMLEQILGDGMSLPDDTGHHH